MPGTGPALDHGGDAVELRRVIVAHKSAAVAVRPAEVKWRAHVASRGLGGFARRIHAAITSFVDAYLLRRGYTFEAGYLEMDNFASIGVADFLGRRRIGYGGYVQWFGRSVPFRTPAVRRIGAELFELRA